MGKKIISSEEFIDRFVECLENGKEFRLENCIVEGDINIGEIYNKIVNTQLDRDIFELKENEKIMKINY
jgi:hypothetical protein